MSLPERSVPRPAVPCPDVLVDAQAATLRAGDIVFSPGTACERFLFVLSGTVAVSLTGRRGRPVGLYRVGPGQACVMTTACLLSGEGYAAEGRAETDVVARLVPAARFRASLAGSEAFRDLVFDAFAERLADMMRTIESVAFEPVGDRLAARLLALAGPEGTAHCTHDALAGELGTAREVVSRQLASWEAAGLIARQRGTITLLDRAALGRRA